jgi:hypothetical protein
MRRLGISTVIISAVLTYTVMSANILPGPGGRKCITCCDQYYLDWRSSLP